MSFKHVVDELKEHPVQMKKSPVYPHWYDVVAGAVSGMGARALTAPLDLLKIRRQLQSSDLPPAGSTRGQSHGEWRIFESMQSIAKQEGGFQSLYRGNVAATCLFMGYSVIQFSLYGRMCKYLTDLNTREEDANGEFGGIRINPTAVSFTAGAAAGVCATVATYPFDLCRTVFAARGLLPVSASNVTWSRSTTLAAMNDDHFQRRPPRSIGSFAGELYNQKGVRGFFAGSSTALMQIVPYMGLNFALHDYFLRISETAGHAGFSALAGAAAGVISKLLVYPLDTVKKQLQAQAFWGKTLSNTSFSPLPSVAETVKPMTFDGTLDCFIKIARHKGPAAFYKGLVPSLVKSSVSTGASFWLFTLTQNVLRSAHDS